MLVELRVLQARLAFKITESFAGDPAVDEVAGNSLQEYCCTAADV